MVGDVQGVTDALADALRAQGLRTCVLVPGSELQLLDDARIQFRLGDESAASELHEMLEHVHFGSVGGLISLLGLSPEFRDSDLPSAATVEQLTLGLFQLLKAFHNDLSTAAEGEATRVISVTGIDGQFGLGTGGELPIASAATIGLFKAYASEASSAAVTCFDVAPQVDTSTLVDNVLDVFEHVSVEAEVGLTPTARYRVATTRTSAPAPDLTTVAQPGDVWVVTGGADGITAVVTEGLAKRGCHLVLMGRSELVDEPAETTQYDSKKLREYFVNQIVAEGGRPIPADIERRVQRVLKQRRIRANLDDFRQMGAQVHYLVCDVRNPQMLAATIDTVYRDHGRIDGLIHGAGVIHDTWISKKSTDSFRAVFETKVSSALTIVDSVRPDDLKYLVFFSSTSARYGNRGQTDYSAANEFLNKLANRLNQQWPGKVVAMNWGPWDSGMVSDELRRAYEKRGIELIPPQEGRTLFEAELCTGQDSEVVVTASLDRIESIIRQPMALEL